VPESRPPSVQALYNRYRPQHFGELIGQQHVVQTLQNALAQNRLSHAYLFSGERGTGKTTAARLLAKAVNCLKGIQAEPCGSCTHCEAIATGSFLDLHEFDAASHGSIDSVRESIVDVVHLAPTSGRYRALIIDEVHRVSAAGKDALLKTLEEPPPHVLFVLATTEPHRVPATIRSRTQHLTFRRISQLDLSTRLQAIADAESTEIDEAALQIITRNSGGSLRDAISLLDQAIAFSNNKITGGSVNTMLGLTSRDAVVSLVSYMLHGDAASGLEALRQAIDDGTSPSTLRQQLINLLRDALILHTSPNATRVRHLTDDESYELNGLTSDIGLPQIVRALEVLAEPDPPSRTSVDVTLELELAFARGVLAGPSSSGNPQTTVDPESPTQAKIDSPTISGAASTASTEPSVPQETLANQQPESTPDRQTAASTADLSGIDIESRRDSWTSSIFRESRAIAPYVGEAEILGFAENVVTLGYRSQFMLDRVERDDAKHLVNKILSQEFGVAIRVKNVLRTATRADRQQKPPVRREDDPVVRVAIREYGATPAPNDTNERG
jgi:DNA polymerase-3 subunit gamma/tau